MKKLFTPFISLMLILTACSGATAYNDGGEGMYPAYTSAEEMLAGSDLVVLVTAGSTTQKRIGGYHYNVTTASIQTVYDGEYGKNALKVKRLASTDIVNYSAASGEGLFEGDKYVLFLVDTGDGYFTPLNPYQGIYELDEAGNPQPQDGNLVSFDIEALDLRD